MVSTRRINKLADPQTEKEIDNIYNLLSRTGFYFDVLNNRTGIGTSSPSYKLDVSDTTEGPINGKSTNASGYGVLGVHQKDGYDAYYGVSPIGGVYIKANQNIAAGSIAFQVLHNLGGVALLTALGNGNVGLGTAGPTSPLQVVGLPIYANNAAAITGGLTAGAFYRTGANPDPVCVVH